LGTRAGRARQARRAHVLDARDRVGGEQFETGLEQKFFAKRIADLHGGAILLRFLGEITRRESRAREAIATRLRTHVEDRVADTARRAASDLLVPQPAEAEDVHERIAVVTLVEINLPADGRDADAISVVRDPRDDARKQPAVRSDCGLRIADTGKIFRI
jgi:hypothetical protein